MSKEKKMSKDEQLKFMKNQYSDLDGWFTKSLELLVNIYQRPNVPGVGNIPAFNCASVNTLP
jgi:hypothetical protein